MKYWPLFLVFLFYTFCTFGQKQGNIWYFGNKAGLDFNSGSPVAISTPMLNTMEGCATLCDVDGKLLFYTDGITIWNRQHQVMENGTGLQGDKSSTQSAVIVPQPGNENLYYLFTVDNVPGTDGVRYSIIDMRLENGAGKIIQKNILLKAPVTEKLTAVKHQNDKDIWVIAHGHNSNIFYTYLVTSAGVVNASQPVQSSVGVVHSGAITNNSIGYMKASPDGHKLALGIRGMKLYELFDFDNTTGILSNPITFQSSDYNVPYGVEFSPDGSKLYINSSQNPTANIYQVDLSNNNAITLIGTSASSYAGSLQVGSDGKIYFARYQGKFLGIIHNPNTAGIACNYVDDGISLGEQTSTFGLPNFIQSFFYKPVFTYNHTCFAGPTSFSITDTKDIKKVEWIFDDPVIGINNISDKIAPTHIFSNLGEYEVILTITYQNNTSRKFSQIINITSSPTIDLGTDTTLCAGATLTLDASFQQATYVWQDGSTKPTYTVTNAGIYWVEVSNGQCTSRDSIQVSYYTPLQVNLGRDTIISNTSSLQLQVSQPDVNCIWQDGSTGKNFTATASGTYWVKVNNPCETVKDEIYINFLPSLQAGLGKDTTLCSGQALQLKADVLGAIYLWQDGSSENTFTVTQAGIYWVEMSNVYGKSRDSIYVSYANLPSIDLGEDIILTQGKTVTLAIDALNAKYLWQDGSTSNTFTVSEPGTYWAEVMNYCGIVRDSITIYNSPLSGIIRDTVLCKGNTLLLQANNSFSRYRWQDGSTNRTFTVDKPGLYWIEATDHERTIRDSIWVHVQNHPSVELGENATLCNDELLILNARQSEPGSTYYWQDGSTNAKLEINTPGEYWVEVSNGCGTVRDSITITCPACVIDQLPNVITPNGDGANDTFTIPCTNKQAWQIEILNRWGKTVYQNQSYHGEWKADGLESGIYYYSLRNPSTKSAFKGVIHVLR